MSRKVHARFGAGESPEIISEDYLSLLALTMEALMLPVSGVTITALTVVCITLMMLPPLNLRLSVLLKNHAYLTAFSAMPGKEQRELVREAPPEEEALTPRERDVLVLVLSGKINKARRAETAFPTAGQTR